MSSAHARTQPEPEKPDRWWKPELRTNSTADDRQRRCLTTRELRLVEGAETVTVSAVEVSSRTDTWRSTSKVLVIYAVDRHDFARDPGACLATAMDAIMRPLLEGLDRGGEGAAE